LWLAYLAFLAIGVNANADPMIRRTWPVAACWLGIAVGMMAVLQAVISGGGVLWRAAPGLEQFGPFAEFEYFAVFAELLFPLLLITALDSGRHRALGIAAAALVAATAAAAGSPTGFLLITLEFGLIMIIEVVNLVRARGKNAAR